MLVCGVGDGFTGEGEAAVMQNDSSSPVTQRFCRQGLNSASGWWDHWDCLKLYPGARSCLSPAASFIVIEPPGDGSHNGAITLSGTKCSRCSHANSTEDHGESFLLLLPISLKVWQLSLWSHQECLWTGKFILKAFRCGTEWPSLRDVRFNTRLLEHNGL